MEKNYNLEKKISSSLKKISKGNRNSLKMNKNKKFDYVENRKICDECGGYKNGEMIEGMMCECGNMREGEIQELGGMDDSHPFFGNKNLKNISKKELEKYFKNKKEDDDKDDYKGFTDGRKKIDKAKPYGKITGDDFKVLNSMKKNFKKGETDESKEFSYAAIMAKKNKKNNFTLDGKKFNVKESYLFKESEMIDLIERIVKEEKKYSSGKEPKGYSEYNRSHRQSKKVNDEYVEEVMEKMKKYLKNGSKGKFSFEPKVFPAGNGELAEMEKMAYIPSDAVGEYIENFTAAALENIDYDTFEPKKEWVDDNIVGSSKTGNNPKWANAVETPTNKKRKEIKDKNLLRKLQLKAYNKSPQPVYKETTGNSREGESNIMRALESTNKTKNNIKEEFYKMKNLISYNKKTQ